MAKQLFGTDGIRGVAGEYPLDPATVREVFSDYLGEIERIVAAVDRLNA